jgi:hypothetical protein
MRECFFLESQELAGDQSNWQSVCSRGGFSLDDEITLSAQGGMCLDASCVLVVLILVRLEVSEKIYLMPEFA